MWPSLFAVMPLYADGINPADGLGPTVSSEYFGCATCHGWKGEGSPARKAPAIAGLNEGYLLTQMNAFASGKRGAHLDDHYGVQMALIARAYPERERERLAKLISALPPINGLETTEVRGDVNKGKVLYTVCAGCHGNLAQGKAENRAPALNRFSSAYLQRQLNNYKNNIRGGAKSNLDSQSMRAIVQSSLLESSQIDDITAYIISLAPGN